MSNIAVIKTGGKQYKIREKQTLKIEKIEGKAGDTVDFSEVLLLADEDGNDVKLSPKTKVQATILEQARDKKVMIVKYKAKVRYKKRRGHRQEFTKVQITKIA